MRGDGSPRVLTLVESGRAPLARVPSLARNVLESALLRCDSANRAEPDGESPSTRVRIRHRHHRTEHRCVSQHRLVADNRCRANPRGRARVGPYAVARSAAAARSAYGADIVRIGEKYEMGTRGFIPRSDH